MVDLCVQIVLLPVSSSAGAGDDFLFADAAQVRFRLFPVWKHSGLTEVLSGFGAPCRVVSSLQEGSPGDVEVVE